MEHKLGTGEMTPEECKEIMKDLMLREYEQKQAEQPRPSALLADWLTNQTRSFLQKYFNRKFWTRPLAQPTIGMDELTASLKSRHF